MYTWRYLGEIWLMKGIYFESIAFKETIRQEQWDPVESLQSTWSKKDLRNSPEYGCSSIYMKFSFAQ